MLALLQTALLISVCMFVQTSKSPFMNVIYDKDPISQWVFGRVALMGEAAHPTTPHGSRRCGLPLPLAMTSCPALPCPALLSLPCPVSG